MASVDDSDLHTTQQAPDSLTSFSMAIQLLTVALGSYLSSALVAIMGAITGTPGWLPPAGYTVNQGHMDYFFYMLGVLQIIGLIIHIPVAMVRINVPQSMFVAIYFGFTCSMLLHKHALRITVTPVVQAQGGDRNAGRARP